MRMLTLITLIGLQGAPGLVQRLPQNPIVSPSSSPTIGENINGPSLIRVPPWVDKPLGRYYLYFSHHAGKFIHDWWSWRASPPADVLAPERDYEGASLPLEVSAPDEAPGRVRQLRDPGIFLEDGRRYLLYSVAGESGLAIGELGRR